MSLTCVVCGKRLKGKQKKYCSGKCRYDYWNSRALWERRQVRELKHSPTHFRSPYSYPSRCRCGKMGCDNVVHALMGWRIPIAKGNRFKMCIACGKVFSSSKSPLCSRCRKKKAQDKKNEDK